MSRSGEEQQCKAWAAGEGAACWRKSEAKAVGDGRVARPGRKAGAKAGRACKVEIGFDSVCNGRPHRVEGSQRRDVM